MFVLCKACLIKIFVCEPRISFSNVYNVESIDERDHSENAAEQGRGVAFDGVQEMLGDVIQNRVQVFGRNLAKVGRHVAEQLLGSPISGVGVSRSKVGHDLVNNLKKKKVKKDC